MGLFCSSGLSIFLAKNSRTRWYKFTEIVLSNAVNDDSCCSCWTTRELYPRIMNISHCISEVHALHMWVWVITQSALCIPPFTAWYHLDELIKGPKLIVRVLSMRIPARQPLVAKSSAQSRARSRLASTGSLVMPGSPQPAEGNGTPATGYGSASCCSPVTICPFVPAVFVPWLPFQQELDWDHWLIPV